MTVHHSVSTNHWMLGRQSFFEATRRREPEVGRASDVSA